MTPITEAPRASWIRIDAPDAPSALRLERRLAHLHAAAVGRGEAWSVELEDADDRMDEILAAVRHWQREQGLQTTHMRVDGSYWTVGVGTPAP